MGRTIMLKDKETEKTEFQMLPLLCNLGNVTVFSKDLSHMQNETIDAPLLWIIMGFKLMYIKVFCVW